MPNPAGGWQIADKRLKKRQLKRVEQGGMMGQSLGRGLLGSLRSCVKRYLRNLSHDNRTLRQARYSAPRRLRRGLIVNRSIDQFLALYALVLVVVTWFYRALEPWLVA